MGEFSDLTFKDTHRRRTYRGHLHEFMVLLCFFLSLSLHNSRRVMGFMGKTKWDEVTSADLRCGCTHVQSRVNETNTNIWRSYRLKYVDCKIKRRSSVSCPSFVLCHTKPDRPNPVSAYLPPLPLEKKNAKKSKKRIL